MARTLIASDDFNRVNGAIGSNWLYIRDTAWQSITPAVENNVVVPKAGGTHYQVVRWAGAGTFANDQYAKTTIGGMSWQDATYLIGVVVRCSADIDTAADYYAFWVNDDASSNRTSKLVKVVNGTETVLDTRTSAWANGDTISLEVSGTTLSAYKNDTLMFSVTDSSLTTGKPGLLIGGGGSVPTADNWEGGDVTTGGGSATLTGANAAQANGASTGAAGVTVATVGANAAQPNNGGTGALSVAVALSGANAAQANNASTGSLTGGTNLSGANASQAGGSSTGALAVNVPLTASMSVQYSFSSTGSLLGALTTPPLKNNTGALLASQSGITVHIYQLSGALVATKTGLSTDTSGVLTVNEPSLVSGTTYRLVIVMANGAEGMDKVLAA